MATVFTVKHVIKGKHHTNRIRVGSTDPEAAKREIQTSLAQDHRCQPDEVLIQSIGDDELAPKKPIVPKEEPAAETIQTIVTGDPEKPSTDAPKSETASAVETKDKKNK